MFSFDNIKIVFKLATHNGVFQRSIKVAVIVGTILTLINQGNLIFNGQQPVWWKVALTYLVPYCVATYGAVSMQLSNIHQQQQQQLQQQPSQKQLYQNDTKQISIEKQQVSEKSVDIELNQVSVESSENSSNGTQQESSNTQSK